MILLDALNLMSVWETFVHSGDASTLVARRLTLGPSTTPRRTQELVLAKWELGVTHALILEIAVGLRGAFAGNA